MIIIYLHYTVIFHNIVKTSILNKNLKQGVSLCKHDHLTHHHHYHHRRGENKFIKYFFFSVPRYKNKNDNVFVVRVMMMRATRERESTQTNKQNVIEKSKRFFF